MDGEYGEVGVIVAVDVVFGEWWRRCNLRIVREGSVVVRGR